MGNETHRRPICFQCGTLHGRWFQPLITTETFCGTACVQAYVRAHQFDGNAQAIHTDACRHFSPLDGAIFEGYELLLRHIDPKLYADLAHRERH